MNTGKNLTRFKQTEIGEIPEDWEIINIGNLGKVITGKTPPTTDRDNYNGDIPFVCIPDLGKNVFVSETNKTLTEKGVATVKNCLLPKNSIAVSCIATIGLVGIIEKPSVTNQQINSIVPNERIMPKFLYYRLQNFEDLLSSYGGGGSVFNIISKNKFARIPLVIPPLSEQQQIASILSSLDDKIELNKKMNKTLEEIGKALFKRWFVDFEFPNDDGKPYKSSGGEMVDSELGEIPKGWETKDLNSISEIKNGFAFKSEDYRDDGVFILRTRNFSQSEYVVKNEVVFVPDNFYEDYKTFQLRKFDVLLVMVGASVGQMGFVTSNALPALQNQNMWNFRARNPNNQIFVKQLVTKIVQENIGSASGSARDFFRKDFFRSIKFASPCKNVLEGFNTTALSLYEAVDKNQGEIEKLTQIRDLLLPKLMNGKLRTI